MKFSRSCAFTFSPFAVVAGKVIPRPMPKPPDCRFKSLQPAFLHHFISFPFRRCGQESVSVFDAKAFRLPSYIFPAQGSVDILSRSTKAPSYFLMVSRFRWIMLMFNTLFQRMMHSHWLQVGWNAGKVTRKRTKLKETKRRTKKSSSYSTAHEYTQKRERHLKRWELKGHGMGGSPNDRLL